LRECVEDAVRDFDLDLVGREPRKVGTDDERVVPAHHVDRRPPRARRVAIQLVEHAIGSAAQLGDLCNGSQRVSAPAISCAAWG
jgi:hypothetical protein